MSSYNTNSFDDYTCQPVSSSEDYYSPGEDYSRQPASSSVEFPRHQADNASFGHWFENDNYDNDDAEDFYEGSTADSEKIIDPWAASDNYNHK